MSTPFRPELSKKNPYYISAHRFYELRHFCFQYPDWKKELRQLDSLHRSGSIVASAGKNTGESDPTGQTAVLRDRYLQKIEMVEKACEDADPSIAKYLLKGVTEGIRYECLRARYEIPCSRDYYYARYHKMFKLLDIRRVG